MQARTVAKWTWAMFCSFTIVYASAFGTPWTRSRSSSTSFCSSPHHHKLLPSTSSRKESLSRRRTARYLSPVDLWDSYNQQLAANPLLVKSVTAGVILGAADLTGQTFERSQKEVSEDVDWLRVARFAVFGLVLQAPWNHYYYLLLDGKIPPTEDPFSATNGIKIFIDQFVQAPIFTVLIFVFLGVLEGKSTDAIQNQLKNDYKNTIVANCKRARGCFVRWDEVVEERTLNFTLFAFSYIREVMGASHYCEHWVCPTITSGSVP